MSLYFADICITVVQFRSIVMAMLIMFVFNLRRKLISVLTILLDK